MSNGGSTTSSSATKTRRKPYSKGFKQAVQYLQDMAERLHRTEVEDTSKQDSSTCKSTSVLTEVARLQELVIGDDGSRATLSKLADFHFDLGEFAEASCVLQGLLAKRRSDDAASRVELADVYRRMADCHEAQGQCGEAATARGEAATIIENLVQQPELLGVFRQLVRAELMSEQPPTSAALVDSETGAIPSSSDPEAAKPISPKRGEVWWVRLPNHPADPHQPRPAVVLSSDRHNEACDEVIVVPLSSSERNAGFEVALPCSFGRPNKKSFTRRWNVTSLDKSFFVKGRARQVLPASVLDQIVAKVQAVLLP